MINTFDELLNKIEADGKNSFCLRFYHKKFIQAKRKLEEKVDGITGYDYSQYALLEKTAHMNTLGGIFEGLAVAGIIDETEIENVEKDLFGEET